VSDYGVLKLKGILKTKSEPVGASGKGHQAILWCPWDRNGKSGETPVQIKAWDNLSEKLLGLSPAQPITVLCRVKSREYNGKWYTDVTAWKIVVGEETKPEPTGVPAKVFTEDDLPF